MHPEEYQSKHRHLQPNDLRRHHNNLRLSLFPVLKSLRLYRVEVRTAHLDKALPLLSLNNQEEVKTAQALLPSPETEGSKTANQAKPPAQVSAAQTQPRVLSPAVQHQIPNPPPDQAEPPEQQGVWDRSSLLSVVPQGSAL